jgi:hypothetical protein
LGTVLATKGISIEFSPFADAELTALLKKRGRVLRKTWLAMRAFARRVRSLAAVAHDLVIVHRTARFARSPLL